MAGGAPNGDKDDPVELMQQRIKALEERCAAEADRGREWARWCREMTDEMERIKAILIVQAGAGSTARDRPTPEPPAG